MSENFLILTVRKHGENKVVWIPKRSGIEIGDKVLVIPIDFQKAIELVKK